MNKLQESNLFCFTMDIDWASEAAVQNAVSYFVDTGIPLTVFCTHKSEYLDHMTRQGKIDVGIHPNFVQPSSQGKTEDDVISYCMNLVPDAKVFRCHRWFAVNDIYEKLYALGLRYESNLCTLLDPVQPFRHRSGMISFPAFFEDGAYLYHKLNLDFQSVCTYFMMPGLKVINIHPMHFVLNTPCFSFMRDIKDRLSRNEWNCMSESEIQALRSAQRGVGDFTKDLVEFAAAKYSVISMKNAYLAVKDEKNLFHIGGSQDGAVKN